MDQSKFTFMRDPERLVTWAAHPNMPGRHWYITDEALEFDEVWLASVKELRRRQAPPAVGSIIARAIKAVEHDTC